MNILRRLMEVSKLTVTETTLSNYGQAVNVLLWTQQHPRQCSYTNAVILSKAMVLDETSKVEGTQGSIAFTIRKLTKQGILERRSSSKRRGTYLINYFHPELPPIVREGKPKELPAEEHGPVVITREATRDEEDAAEHTIADVDEKVSEETAEPNIPDTEEPTVETVCPEPITVKTDGGEIKLSITLNINIAR